MASPHDDRFGTGLARPFRRDKTGFVTVSGRAKVLQGVEQVIGTSVGKLPWRCKFGCRVPRLRHMNNNQQLKNLARVDISDALQAWEPRCRVKSVVVGNSTKDARNQINITVSVEIAGKTDSVKRTI
jgi:phage baseplate assembly protein W